jgi:CBS-domain-containing membrane protein
MSTFLQKLAGDQAQLPPRPTTRAVLLAWLGAFIAIGAVAALTNFFAVALIFGPLGASCLLAFGFPDAPFSQPRNIVGGHMLSSLVGLIFVSGLGVHWWVVALAGSTAIASMMLMGIPHPPAASNPIIIFLSKPTWIFLVFPTLAGTLLLVVVALIYNNLIRHTKYPKYW